MRGEAHVMLSLAAAVVVVQREAHLMAQHLRAGAGCQIMEISWHSASGPYPPFKGTLSACQDDAGRSAGSYDPALGIVGVAFEAVLGHHLAEEAIRELLASVRAALEALYVGRARKTESAAANSRLQ